MASLADTTLDKRERRVLQRLVDDLRASFGDRLEAVWLYGSRARGEYPRPGSDVDILVLVSTRRRGDFEVVAEHLVRAADPEGLSPFDFSAQVHDREWLENRRAIESFFIQEVDRDKVDLLEPT
jgi:predicted nucleotidyltransferase